MRELGPISTGRFSHDLLVHDGDEDLVRGMEAFVGRGLTSGGHVVLHGMHDRVALLRDAFGVHPRLEYSLDGDARRTPSSALWASQRMLAESPGPAETWIAGTVPVGHDGAAHPSWARHEALANVALGDYAFHVLCALDTRVHPQSDIAAGRATHPCVSTPEARSSNPAYLEPADFLTDPLAWTPAPPQAAPSASAVLHGLHDLSPARETVWVEALASRVSGGSVGGLVTAVNEVLVNALVHGGAPVRLDVWVEPSQLTCRVVDSGHGIQDLLAGCRYPGPSGPYGLWVARQACEEVLVANLPGGGCSVLLTSRSEP